MGTRVRGAWVVGTSVPDVRNLSRIRNLWPAVWFETLPFSYRCRSCPPALGLLRSGITMVRASAMLGRGSGLSAAAVRARTSTGTKGGTKRSRGITSRLTRWGMWVAASLLIATASLKLISLSRLGPPGVGQLGWPSVVFPFVSEIFLIKVVAVVGTLSRLHCFSVETICFASCSSLGSLPFSWATTCAFTR